MCRSVLCILDVQDDPVYNSACKSSCYTHTHTMFKNWLTAQEPDSLKTLLLSSSISLDVHNKTDELYCSSSFLHTHNFSRLLPVIKYSPSRRVYPHSPHIERILLQLLPVWVVVSIITTKFSKQHRGSSHTQYLTLCIHLMLLTMWPSWNTLCAFMSVLFKPV